MSISKSIYAVTMWPFFIFIFIVNNDIISLKQTHLLYCLFFRICYIAYFLEYALLPMDDNVDRESK